MPIQHTTTSRTISRSRAQSRRKRSFRRDFPGKLIHQAAIYSNYELLKDLIQGAQKKFINDKDSFGRTALHAVCAADLEERKASVKCVELLLQCGAEPNTSANDRYHCFTPLHLAARDGKMETMKLLLDFGADIEIKDSEHCKPMDVANKNCRKKCADFLHDIQDEREKLRKEVEPQILQACADGNLSELKALLKRVGLAAINKDYQEGVTPLFKASCNGHLEVVNYLIDRGASGRANDSGCKWTPLYAACLYGYTKIAEVLMKYFPSMAGDITQDQQLPLHAAAAGGYTEIVKLLLYYDYSVINEKGKTKLHQKTSSNLKAYKGGLPFHINLCNINGQTSLYLASAAGHVEVVKTLLEFQPNRRKHHSMPFTNSTRKKPFVDVNTYTVVGQTPLHAAVLSWNVEITSLLLKYGADVNAPIQSLFCLFDNTESKRISPKFSEKVFFTKENSSLLFEACSAFDYKLEIITLLLKHGAKDTEGKALLSALLSRRDDIVRVMLGHSGVHPDSEFTVNSDCLAEFKAASCAVTVDQLGTEPLEKRSGKSVKESSNHAPHYSKMAQQLKDGGRSISRDRRRTVAIPKRLVSNSASFDVPVAIDWHDMELILIETDWLVEASLRYNITLQNYEVSPGIQHPALSAITRIDISDNSLSELPLVIFQLPSLHVLNAAKNKISKLPIGKSKKETVKVEKSDKRHTVASILSTAVKNPPEVQEVIWNCPMLTQIDLNNNWLEKLPAVMFHLPSLETLNVHGNKLKQLPFDMWMASKLKNLDLSKNKLEELPSNILDGLDDSQTFHSSTASHKDKKQSNEFTLDMNDFKKERDEDGDSGMEEGDKFRPIHNYSESSSRTAKKGRTLTETSEQSTTSSNSEVFGNEKPKRKHTLLNVRRHQLWSTSSLGYDEVDEEPISADEVNCLEVLNLSKNQLTKIPTGLPCLAPKLSKLILSENKITDFGPINKFPAGLVDLEVSNNLITSMTVTCRRAGSLSRKDSILKMLHVNPSVDNEKKISDLLGIEPCCSPAIQSQQNVHLMAPGGMGDSRRDSKDGQSISSPLQSPPAVSLQYCKHRRHRVLANLRTLDLTNNNIKQLQVVSRTEEINFSEDKELEDSGEHDQSCVSLCFPVEDKTELQKEVPKIVTNHPSPSDDITLLFPDLAFLAVSNNNLTEVPKDIQYLTKLSNLRIDGNELVTTLPPEMGRLQNLYDLKVDGCSLTEPLSSMTSNLLVKDVLGYLRCILDDAKPYARMKLMFVGKACIGKTTLLNELRREGSGPYGNQSPESFAERQGNTHIGGKTLKGNHLSTVGVDVSEWTYCKKKSKYGKVTFSTWDFGGQQEFYATHQYFLTKRSLYLVLWKLTDGEKGINELQQWLVNIQARAPNSPVIIVGTHLDVLRSGPRYSRDYLMDLTRKVNERFIDIAHPQDLGLPDVRAFVPVNCVRGSSVTKLRDTIYDTAFSITGRDKRDREPLLKHPVPTSYLALEKAIAYLAAERRDEKKEPVLTTTEYRTEVTHVMQMQSQVSFHDKEELMQATRFLHNNGILLHYEDAMLADYYFLDPQWLCDTLAKVVTIPEINPCVKSGVMKIDDLKMKFQSSGVKHYILSLLNKFEVAVAFDSEHLLIPSLLPQEGEMICIPVNRENINITQEFLPLQSQIETARVGIKSLHLPSPKPVPPERDQTFFQTTTSSILAIAHEVSARFSSPAAPEDGIKRNGFKTLFPQNKRPRSTSPILVRRTDENAADQYQAVFSTQPIPETEGPGFSLTAGENPYAVIRRLFFLQYIPSGFWSRVISRFLSDQILNSIIETLYTLPKNAEESFGEDIHQKWSSGLMWMCWQTGIELSLHGVPLFHVKEINKESLLGCVFKKERRPDTVQVLVSTIDGQDRTVSTSRLGQLEILIPNQILSVQKEQLSTTTPSSAASSSGSSICGSLSTDSDIEVLPSLEIASRLLAAIVDLLDVLLENFYPTLYEPLGQTFEGELLITRIVPCIRCWIDYNKTIVEDVDETDWEVVDWNPDDIQQALHEEGVSPKPVRRTPKTEIQSMLRQHCPRLYKGKKENTIWTISSPINGKLQLPLSNYDHSLKRTQNENGKKKTSKDSSNTDNDDSGIDAPELPGGTPEVVVQNPTIEKSRSSTKRAKVGGLLLPEQAIQVAIDENNQRSIAETRSASKDKFIKNFSPKTTPSHTPKSLTPDKERRSLEFSACFRLGSFSDTEGPYKVYGFLFEELVLRGMKYEEVKCPNHGRILLKNIAPDVVYHDLGPGKLIDKSNLEVAKLLGIGSFGFVYKGHMVQEDQMSEIPVAIKMLQPYPPGQGASNTIKQRYEMNDSKWHRDPLRNSCEAYHTARKELSIIMTLDHSHIVPLLGFCRQPMCLILELAPHGALDARLEDYKRVGARLTSPVIQQIIVQVSSAVDYLHQKGIIYRDLKAENVLVWNLPEPHLILPCEYVQVKLADYGISVSTLPSGTKGYGGTPGYMAPEIVQYEGKETYTEKVDCFSFGMFMYELMSMQRPFESQVGKNRGRLSEVIKQLIKDGERPILTRKEQSYPVYILDLMVWCWAQDPRDRPSMQEVHQIASMPEFANLHEVLSLDEEIDVAAACSITSSSEMSTASEAGLLNVVDTDIWISHSNANVQILTYSEKCIQEENLNVMASKASIVCMCFSADSYTVWLSLSIGLLAVYSVSNNEEIARFRIPPTTNNDTNHVATAMVHIDLQQQMVVATDTGYVIVFDEGDGYVQPQEVFTYRYVGEKITSLALAPNSFKCERIIELWCGNPGGNISILNVGDFDLCMDVETVKHFEEPLEVSSVDIMVSYDIQMAERLGLYYVWTYVYPGTSVYRWTVETRKMEEELDVAEILCSDLGVNPSATMKRLSANQCQVSSMCLIKEHLYIGTVWGRLIIADSLSLSPITTVQCHRGPIKSILPIRSTQQQTQEEVRDDCDQSEMDIFEMPSKTSLVTIGKGFHNLIAGYPECPSGVKVHDSSQAYYILTWNADSWDQLV
ncbi:leucine-rich repeat serine/threonine-protein kinase 1-like isoform X2 [Anneissia japonica]|uniref:leucine-rich repeat serine/threonine-protein kinase 1-like isoform X2 n=1 Tax=Anneissia japonica TaxID=1529436 RepID=UPI0014255AA0|nr:leucine-rich repeat serine/threonine-protein kinase 1-like isoform X2 [Anneissia japonica]